MLAVPSILISSILPITRRAHVLGIVLSVHMGALRDLHHLLHLLWRLDTTDHRLCLRLLWSDLLGALLRLFLVSNEFSLQEVLEQD